MELFFDDRIKPRLSFLLIQAANIEVEASGVDESEFQLVKHDFSSLGCGRYSGMLKHFYFTM